MLIEEGVRITRGIGHASTGMDDTDDEPLVHVGPKRKALRQKGSNHSYRGGSGAPGRSSHIM